MGTAVVVGGGIAGLAAAIGLRRIGWDVTVLERRAVLEDAGAGISVQANGMRSLDVLGVGDAVRAVGAAQGSGGIRVPGGSWLAHMDTERAEKFLGSPVYSFLRADLHRVLRAALPEGCLVTGATVHEVSSKPDTAEVRYSRVVPQTSATAPRVVSEGDSPVSEGDSYAIAAGLVVGADGVHSGIRSLIWPDHPGAVYAGSTIWRGVTAGPVPVPADIDQTWGRGTEFGSTRLPGGRVEWHAEISAPAGRRHPDPLAEVVRRFGTWHDPIPALLAATPPGTILHHDIHEVRTPLPSYVADRVVLIGDAAHGMTPHLGQGASLALEDAVCLAAYLSTEKDTDAALARFDRERRPRTQAGVVAARRTGNIGQQLDGRLSVALRNLAIRLTPVSIAVRGMVKQARWEPPALEPGADAEG